MKKHQQPPMEPQKMQALDSATRVAVIVSPGSAKWGSCHTIGSNLRRAYELAAEMGGLKGRFDFLEYGDDFNDQNSAELVSRILNGNYTCVSFIEHWPPAFRLVRALVAASRGRGLPAFLVHVYGDFTFHSPDMLSTFYLLQGQKVRPLCASHGQIKLLSSLLQTGEGSVGYCPFPVNPAVFFPSTSLRDEERRLQGWDEDDFVLLYTGRVSMQKNVTLAIKQVFERVRQLKGRSWRGKFHFAIAGKYDDLGMPFFGNHPPDGAYFFMVQKTISELDPAVGNVCDLGDLPAEKLNRVYNAADAFVSLSLHHDEDYGMSPAEALACGLPCLLSDWGGYPSFAAVNSPESESVRLAPVRLSPQGYYFPQPDLQDGIGALLCSGRRSPEARVAAAKRLVDGFGLKAVAERLLRELAATESSTVGAPTPAFLELAKKSVDSKSKGMTRIYRSYSDPLYRKIYSTYVGG